MYYSLIKNELIMRRPTIGNLFICTSNIVVTGNKQSFPEEYKLKSRLNFYSSLCNSVEINSSFYKVPMQSTFQKWCADVPENFRFSIKLLREITHVKNLAIDLKSIDTFLQAASGINDKKGCLLIQFPGKITLEYYSQLEQLLIRLVQTDEQNKWQPAIEFRNPSWYVSEAYKLLNEYRATMVVHDMPKAKNYQINEAGAFVYVRYHGPAGDYKGSYSIDFLQQQYHIINGWLNNGKDVYVYFNNTMGNALQNALALQRIAVQKAFIK